MFWYILAGVTTVYSLVAGVALGVLGGRVSERVRVACAFGWPVAIVVLAIAAVPMLACWTGHELGEQLGARFTPRRRKSVAAGGHDASTTERPIPFRVATGVTARFDRRAA